MSGVATEVLCSDCEGGPERCARAGHLRTWRIESTDPAVAIFCCARCNETFKVPRCASCGGVVDGPRGACDHPPAGPP